MDGEGKKVEHAKDPDTEYYGDPGIMSRDAEVPKSLIFSYFFWIVWGFITLYLFWNGSWGWLDRGYWQELQRAANTVYPFTTTKILEKDLQDKSE